jgi:hypothetical protein
MAPENIRFGGGATSTVLHPLVLAAMVIAIALIYLLPRKYIVVPFLMISMLTPWGQTLVLAGVHFTVVRIVVLFAWVRLLWLKISSRLRPAGGLNSIDAAFSWWALFYAFAFMLLWWQMQAFINRVGFLLDAFGIYYLLRFLIQDDEDVHRVIKTFAIIAAVIALAMVTEQFTRRDIFGLLGGVSPHVEVRDGLVRSHGVFQHAILAGSFGATLLPLFIGLWTQMKSRAAAIIGIISATTIVMTSSSSTPLLTYTAVIVALCFWPLRRLMRTVRWGIVLGIIALQLVMKAPVWWAIAHVNVAGGSSYHRAALVDVFIRHFGDWWLLGAKHYDKWGWDMWDVSNQFCAMGLNGGLGGFVAFLAMISRGFGKLGSARKYVEGDRRHELFLWCMGSALFGHIVAFFGTGYWDQTEVAWFALLAIISTSTAVAMPSHAVQGQEVAHVQGEKSLPGMPLPAS